jgi:CspA family cold shock protein
LTAGTTSAYRTPISSRNYGEGRLEGVVDRISHAVEAPMAVGKVKWFNDEKGWGFIKQDNGADVFVHYSQISGDGRRRLFEDETVEFEIKEGPKGLQAINVVRQEPTATA